MTVIYYSCLNNNLSQETIHEKLTNLPKDVRKGITKFKRKQDQLASLYGKLLLQEGLFRFGMKSSLNDLQYTKYNKPYVKNNQVSFNISHSGDYVVCAISNEVNTLGIDIEKNQKINFNDFQNIWTERELKLINKKTKIFYKYWTRKEALIKADGRGFMLDLKKIDVVNSKLLLNDKLYYLKEININVDYTMHLASPLPMSIDKVSLTKLSVI